MVEAPPKRSKALGLVGVATTAVAIAVLMTWPLAREASHHILRAAYHWDAYTNTMIMGGHVDAIVRRGPLSLYDNYFFAPLPDSVVFNENLFGLTLLFAPFYLVTDNPLWAYNLTLLLSLSLSVVFTYLLVRRLTGSGHAGVLAGVVFAFSPYVMFEIGRIQLVATQWIPACFLMLHRAIEGKRLRDVAGLWLCYLLQIGTCLYYAMFLAPLLTLVAVVLLVRRRPSSRFYAQLVAVGVAAALTAWAMVYPYFRVRAQFDLERSISFASRYDGKLGFFANVHETNLTLTALHHSSQMRGAHEEIAFPGFTVLSMALLSLGVPLWHAFRCQGSRKVLASFGRWLAIAVAAVVATLVAHNMLVGAVVFGLGIWWRVRFGPGFAVSERQGLYLAVFVLSVVLFLGLSPMKWDGVPVRGLYYYLHAYVPGFNGIRKIGRQAVMTTFALALLSSFGSAYLFSWFSRKWAKGVVLTVLLVASCYELRCFPHPLKEVWVGATVPSAYRFLSSLPRGDYVAAVPQNDGAARFHGDAGLTLHNYLALFHKHRIITGQSSWTPPVTTLVLGALRQLPDDGARRILQSVGARHLLLHTDDLGPSLADLPERLAAQPAYYRKVFEQGPETVFSLLAENDDSLTLAETPRLPQGARVLAQSELHAHASLRPEHARKAVDGNPRTFWSGESPQGTGQYFELMLTGQRRLVAFEIASPGHVAQVPLSFHLSVAQGGSDWQTVVSQPLIRVYREQVHSPKTFVLRIVLPNATPADRVRITIDQPVPAQQFAIHEARVYVEGTK